MKPHTGIQKPDLLRRTQQFIIWLGVLPVVLAFVSYRTSSDQVAAVAATLSTNEFIRVLDELLSTVQDAETGQRGYLLTGKESYLGPFLGSETSLPPQLSKLEDLASKQGFPPEEYQELRKLVQDKLSELRKTVELKALGRSDTALAIVDTDRGQSDMVAIRALVRKLKDEQVNAFSRKLAAQQEKQRQLDLVLAVGVVFGFFLLSLAYQFNKAYARERDQAEAQIRLMNQTLELRVQERTAELQSRTGQLEARSEELQRSNADLMQFAYIASHDLQEPLRMVGSYMGLLTKKYRGQLDETAERYIQFAIDGANRMQALIYDLLKYSRAGTQALEKTRFSLKRIVETATQNLEVAIQESGAVIDYGNLPTIEGDELKLSQVMQNLIGNAIKFRKPGTRPEIKISAEPEPRQWIISVSDNGIGFDPKYSDRIFQVFQRLHATGEYPGNGIGLAICRRIVKHHGGQLWAQSQPEVGSVFYFTIPRRETAETKILEPVTVGGTEAEPAAHT